MRSKILRREDVAACFRSLRAQGKKVVFTNGCFDIIHPGHIHLLREARRLGDVLVVAVNTDESIRRLKGAGRPIFPLAERMEILAAFLMVDYVFPFDEDTPLRAVEEVVPHVLVKGGDWAVPDIVGSDFVKARGGEVVSLPHRAGYSTTGILARLAGEEKP
jgi:D-beta-D-heptose 7-phosphate kinase/D-beta-D-heptose 1-phosphate adenosyltransferase